MKHTQEKLEDICQALRTDPSRGLNDAQVRERQSEVGLNKFDEAKKESILQKVLRHSKDLTTIILMAAVVISLIVAISGTGDKGPVDAAIIFLIVVINVFLAVRQEMGAEKALDALKNMHAHMTVVLRGGVKQTVDAVDLVPGDILVLEAGDRIPADARILESVNLEVEESALTGESVPAEKDANAAVPENATLGDQTNMLFSECLIVNGRAKAVVVETGMNTEIGKIAGMLNSSKRQKTPLQKRLDGLGKALTIIALISAVILFAVELLIYAQQFSSVLMNAVALAVAVVPEMLPVTATVTLAYGVLNMAKQNAIIRKIPAVETLGSATVICSDKTGTLTMNRMTIQRLWAAGHAPVKAEE
ncbi:MAG: HAD-IC family P-type ATPase, partial [Firmicutes bacterium]|nr:HAD-IC family P-type ATPase [Bacillota bacterium]